MDQLVLTFKDVEPPQQRPQPSQVPHWWTQIKSVVDLLEPGGKGKEIEIPDAEQVEAVRIYALSYVTKYVNPSDWHLRTHRLSSNKLIIWKAHGTRQPYETRRKARKRRDYKYAELHAILDNLVADDPTPTMIPAADENERERKQREVGEYQERMKLKRKGFKYMTKTMRNTLYVWKVSL
jgi:hypothetical protein